VEKSAFGFHYFASCKNAHLRPIQGSLPISEKINRDYLLKIKAEYLISSVAATILYAILPITENNPAFASHQKL